MLGYRTRKSTSWIRPEGWNRFEERRGIKEKLIGVRSARLRTRSQEEYRNKYFEVKRSIQKDMREWPMT